MALITLCGIAELPEPGQMRELTVQGKTLCLANHEGQFAATDNVCPHRGGPLAKGTLAEGKVLCPWHAWAFDLASGTLDHDASIRIAVYPLCFEDGNVQVEL